MIHGCDPETDRRCRRADRAARARTARSSSSTRTAGSLPTGSWGELVVRRPGMAPAYLNLPELSAERFGGWTGPTVGAASTLSYRTGDRVRIERPGVAVYGGRLDDQLKIGGVRFEPGEIEAALVALPEITTASCGSGTLRDQRARGDARCGACAAGSAPTCPASSLDAERRVLPLPRLRRRRAADRGVVPHARDLDERLDDARRRGAAETSTASTCCRAARTRPTRSTSSSSGAGECTRSPSTTGSSPTERRRTSVAPSPTSA